MKVYFAGVNQYEFCEAFVGRQVLETYTDHRCKRMYGRYRAVFQSMALDCGAFSKDVRDGKVKIDLAAYADFVAEHGRFYDWCASLDSIRGGVEENLRNWQFLLDRKLETMPTFHQGEPLSVLEEYCARTQRVGLGFKRDKHGRTIAGTERPFLDEAFSVIPASVKIHGWAMTSYTAAYPFASVDSTTWLHELKALRAVRPAFQEGFTLEFLTDGELIDIVQKKYDRLPRTEKWAGVAAGEPVEPTRQLSLLRGVGT